jgi:hypothetical protein
MSVLQFPVRGADDAVALVRALVPDGAVEGMLVVGLDRDRRLCGVGLNPHHRALSFVKVWELEALAAELDACALVIGLFPSGPIRAPSPHELVAFVDLCTRARRAQMLLFDCIVVRGHRWWSMRELALVDLGQQPGSARR